MSCCPLFISPLLIVSTWRHLSYERVDEIIWVKTNQLQRIIRTGRTGHWLNHGKEHCLVNLKSNQSFFLLLQKAERLKTSWALFGCLQVGVKGSTQGFNRGLDCDVIVAEVKHQSSSDMGYYFQFLAARNRLRSLTQVRSTSHKPDEIYGMIERLSPGTRKIELFGRPHNVQPNW